MTYYNFSFFLPFHSSSWNEWDDKINTINSTFSNFILFLRMMMDITLSRAGIFFVPEKWSLVGNRERHFSSQTPQTYPLENCSVRAPSVLGQHRRHSSRNSLPRFSIRTPLCHARNPPFVRTMCKELSKHLADFLPCSKLFLQDFLSVFENVFRKITKQNKKKNLN